MDLIMPGCKSLAKQFCISQIEATKLLKLLQLKFDSNTREMEIFIELTPTSLGAKSKGLSEIQR